MAKKRVNQGNWNGGAAREGEEFTSRFFWATDLPEAVTYVSASPNYNSLRKAATLDIDVAPFITDMRG